MKSAVTKFSGSYFWLIVLTVILKIPLFFTNNIQEDSFITWRVAGNLLDYGTIGFNGDERISASTTHLYVVITAFFRIIFGDYFIYPLLTFSGILFAIGSVWLSKILMPKDLTTFAQISKDVVLSSAVNIIEIWDKDLYEKAIDDSIVDFADLAEDVMGNVNDDDNGIS